jgi:hypothetical protein
MRRRTERPRPGPPQMLTDSEPTREEATPRMAQMHGTSAMSMRRRGSFSLMKHRNRGARKRIRPE